MGKLRVGTVGKNRVRLGGIKVNIGQAIKVAKETVIPEEKKQGIVSKIWGKLTGK